MPSEASNTSISYPGLLWREPFFKGIFCGLAGFGVVGVNFVASLLYGTRYSNLRSPVSALILECSVLSGILWGAIHRMTRGGAMSKRLLLETNLTGQHAIITGGSAGIGKATAVQLLRWGATVYMCTRNPEKTAKAVEDILKEANVSRDKIVCVPLVLDDLDSVKECARILLEKNVSFTYLINNAAVMLCPLSLTKQGLENQFGTCHMGHMYLTLLLLANIKGCNGRVITVSSLGHSMISVNKETGRVFTFDELVNTRPEVYGPQRMYAIAKLANIYFTQQLQLREFTGTGATAYVCHPGAVKTELIRHMDSVGRGAFHVFNNTISKSPMQGAQTSLYLAAAPLKDLVPGGYYADCTLCPVSKAALDRDASKDLWDESIKFLQQKMGYAA